MQRKMLVSLAATACSLTGSGAVAMAVRSGERGAHAGRSADPHGARGWSRPHRGAVSTTKPPSRPPSTTADWPTTTAAPAAQTATYTSAGGSFTLRWTSTAMLVVSTSPNSGYQARTEGAGTEIHVLLTSSNRDIEIMITLVGGSPHVKGLGNG